MDRDAISKYTIVFYSIDRLLVLDTCILITEKSRIRVRFISYSKYSRRGTLFIQKKVGSALTETKIGICLLTVQVDVRCRCSPI